MSIQTEYRRSALRIITAYSFKDRRAVIQYMRHHMYGRFLPGDQLPIMPNQFPMFLYYVHRGHSSFAGLFADSATTTAALQADKRLEINEARTLHNTLGPLAGQGPILLKISHPM